MSITKERFDQTKKKEIEKEIEKEMKIEFMAKLLKKGEINWFDFLEYCRINFG